MYKKITFPLLIILSFIFCQCRKSIFTICDDGESKYIIVISGSADSLTRYAASELQEYLNEISGVRMKIVYDSVPPSEYEIVVGKSNRFENSPFNNDIPTDEGFIIATHAQQLFIAGGGRKGTLYGVYDFLERYLDCRMYAPDALLIPRKKKIILPNIYDIQHPVFSYRETLHPFPIENQKYADWHKLHNRADIERDWGLFVHTYQTLIPSDKYFKKYPEWFSEVHGKRIKDGQLCLSNEAMRMELIRNLQQFMKEKPDAQYWSVSDNDNYNHCTCTQCAELDRQYGNTASGSLLWFINQVAAEFPDKTISTLAYQFSRKAPQNIVPADNVNIMLCSIECNRALPLADDPGEEAFRKDVEDWTSLTHNIFMWDYVVQFRNYFDPFPNLHILQPNLQYFADHGVKMIFEQGSNCDVSEFHQLRTYLIAKLLWNPYQDADLIMNDFLSGYYGAAGEYIGEYIHTMKKALLSSNKNLGIYQYPIDAINSYLTPELIPVYESIFNKAEEAVANNPVLADRVRFARMPLNFAILDLSCFDITEQLSFFKKDKEDVKANDLMIEKLHTFCDNCEHYHIHALAEWNVSPPNQFRENILSAIRRGEKTNFASGKKVTSLTEYSQKYNVKGASALTDRLFGFLDYRYNWLGFEGNDMEVIVDLENAEEVSYIAVNFLETPLSWIFLPKKVEFFVSLNGKNWHKTATITHSTTENLGSYQIKDFNSNFPPVIVRFVKVKAESLKTCPEWHRGYGFPCWIFADEIVVR